MRISQNVAMVVNDSIKGYPKSPIDYIYNEQLYSGKDGTQSEGSTNNYQDVYEQIKESIVLLGKSQGEELCPKLNPLGWVIKPGNKILIKPNFVYHKNKNRGIDSLITNPSVIMAVVDMCLTAMKSQGTLIIGDAPIQGCKYAEILKYFGPFLASADGRISKLNIKDFRAVISDRTSFGSILKHSCASYEHGKCITVDMGNSSHLASIDEFSKRFRVTCYDPSHMKSHHSRNKHEYSIARDVLEADVVINIGKMKTHGKTGITGALKNIVGINTNKDYLPHYRIGSPYENGDEYRKISSKKRICSRLTEAENTSNSSLYKKACHIMGMIFWGTSRLLGEDRTWEGAWPGNDTLWRTILDINDILYYADANGKMQESQQRRVINIIDGIIGGEGNGPLSPTDKYAGVILSGTSAAAVDAVMATIMGFEWRKIKVIDEAMKDPRLYPFSTDGKDITVISNDIELCGALSQKHKLYSFKPARYWESIVIDRKGSQ